MDACRGRVASNSLGLAAGAGELLALRETKPGKWLVAVYREFKDNGFVITAFLTRRGAALERREQLWP